MLFDDSYKISFCRNYEEMTDQELKKLIQDFEEKFIKYKIEISKQFYISYMDALLEYCNEYSLEPQILGEMISQSTILLQKFSNDNETNEDSSIDDNSW